MRRSGVDPPRLHWAPSGPLAGAAERAGSVCHSNRRVDARRGAHLRSPVYRVQRIGRFLRGSRPTLQGRRNSRRRGAHDPAQCQRANRCTTAADRRRAALGDKARTAANHATCLAEPRARSQQWASFHLLGDGAKRVDPLGGSHRSSRPQSRCSAITGGSGSP